MRLLQLSAAWGAPSIDAECSRVQAYLHICGLLPGTDFVIEDCDNPQIGAGGRLPVLELGSRLAEPAELYAALREGGHDADKGLSACQRADSTAYTALITERLGVALLYSWWVDEENYEVIRSAYAGKLAFPLCYYLPWTIRRKVQSQLARRACVEPKTAHAHGEEALSALAARYGESTYFHGDRPSAVDAAAFGYLSAVLRCPVPNDQLRRALRAHPNLVALVERMSKRFFDGSAPLLDPEAPPLSRPPSSGKAVAEVEAVKRAGTSSGAGSSATGGPSDANAAEIGPAESSKSKRTPKQQRFRQRSRNTLIGMGVAAVAFYLANDVERQRQQQQVDSDDESD